MVEVYRRSVIAGTVAVGSTVIAGCQSDDGNESNSSGGDSTGDGNGTADDDGSTDDGSTTDSAPRLRVVGSYGTDVDRSAGTIRRVELHVESPDSDDFDLENLTIQWVSPNETANLVAVAADSDLPTFTIGTVEDDDASIAEAGTLDAPGDRARLSIDLTQPELTPLSAGSSATMTLTPAMGGRTPQVTIAVPETLQGDRVEL